jgi:cobalt/nickel transport system ATP-binding protein
MTTLPPILELGGIDYAYPDGPDALSDVSLVIAPGTKLALLGANGAGKSTLLLHLNGTLRPRRGEVRWRGRTLDYSRAMLNRLRSEVAVVFQNPDDQLFAGSGREDVSFGPMNLGLSEIQVRQRVEASLTLMNLEAVADQPPHRLSFGQKKRAAIAGALAMQPSMLILDEPTAGLDPRGQATLMAYLETLHQNGITLVISTHDLELARKWASEVVVMSKGRLILCCSADQALADDARLREAELRVP